MDMSVFVNNFVKGSLKNGSRFFGRVHAVDDKVITISGGPDTNSTKFVMISEISEIEVAPIRERGE